MTAPREVKRPDVTGWWARNDTMSGKGIRWVRVDYFDDEPPGVWDSVTEEFRPLDAFCKPWVEWFGPIALPENWSEDE